MAFDLQAQIDFTNAFGEFYRHTQELVAATAMLNTDISPKHIAAVRSSMREAIKVLDELEAIAATGTVITDVEAAKVAIEKMLPKLPPKLTIV